MTEGGTYRLTIFELGTYAIPSVSISYEDYSERGLPAPASRAGSVPGGRRTPRRSVRTQPIPIVVRSLIQESDLSKEAIPRSVKEADIFSQLRRMGRGAMILLAAVGVVSLTIFGFFYFSPKGPVYRPPPPAHLSAGKALKEIAQSRRDPHIPPQELYGQLSQILRGYLAGRFKTLRLDLPTAELLTEMKAEKTLTPFLPELSAFFEKMDLVKFAGRPASAEEWDDLLQLVRQFVSKTTPREGKG